MEHLPAGIIGLLIGVLGTLWIQAILRYEKDRHNLVKLLGLEGETDAQERGQR